MSNLAEKYDFSLFENTAPALPEKEPEKRQRPKQKPVELPKPKVKRNWAKIAAWSLSSITVTSIAGLRVNKEVEITMLTDQIQTVQTQLNEAKAEEIQLNMLLDMRFNLMDFEKYAREELGMGPITKSQVIYINPPQEDKGVVHMPVDENKISIVDKIAQFFSRLID